MLRKFKQVSLIMKPLSFSFGIFLKYDQNLDASEQAPRCSNTNDEENSQAGIVSFCFTLFLPNLWPLI